MTGMDEAAAGDEVQITKHGQIMARLVPASGSPAVRGALAGTAQSTATDEDLFSTAEAWELG
jgi:antitoxin (DNA-binding transcriptional repressor) of toxin-antitoxin stability system